MSDMKCPFCQQKLESFSVENRPVFACCNLNYKGYFMNAPKELWQELIRTRKALEIAVDAINTGKTLADIAGFKMLVAGLEKAIEQITTQVQTNK